MINLLRRVKNYYCVNNKYEFLLYKNRYEEGCVNIEGLTICYPDAKSLYYMYKDIYKNKCYDFINYGSPVIIDIGSNVGLHIIRWCELFDNPIIVSYEADNYIFQFLEKNLKNNNLLNSNLSILNNVVYDYDGYICFESTGADDGRVVNENNAKANKIKCVSAKSVVDMYDHIDLLKIDAEGSENNIIESIESELYKIDRIFFEYHSEINDKQVLSNMLYKLEKNNFRYYIKTNYCSNNPFLKIDNQFGYDLLLNIYAFK